MVTTRTLNKKVFRDLWSLKSQTLTTAFLIISGVALLVAQWSAYKSLQKARDDYYQEYQFADIFAEFKPISTDTLHQLRQVESVEIVEPRISVQGRVQVAPDREPAIGRFVSIPSGMQPQLNKVHLRKGRLPIDGNTNEALVFEGFAQAHQINSGDTIEITVQGRNELIQIVGIALSPEFVYALGPNAPLPDDLHFGVFWLTEKNLQRLLGLRDSYNNLTARLSGANQDVVIHAFDQILKPFGSLGAYGRDRQVSNMFVADEISQQRVSSIFVPGIFLAIAAFLINIVASRLISLHRGQIASLKALGYSNFEVSTHYLKLIFFMTLFGAVPGLAIGAWLGQWFSATYESYFRFPKLDFNMSPMAAALGLIAGVLPGLVGALASIYRIYRMSPAEAMQPSAPTVFHASILDRLGLNQIASVPLRMAFRHLLLRPLRLFLIVLSISCAIAVVVTAGSWADMVDHLLITQFQRLQKEDLSVALIRPQSSHATEELRKLPGVVAVEGYRSIPIRIRYLNLKRELGLTGWPTQSSMRELLNEDLRPIPLPPKGILLSRYFQKNWKMKLGDVVEIEILDGDPKRLFVPVMGFTDEPLGLSANMTIEYLWSILQEEPSYNVFTLQVDHQKMNSLYLDLTAKPEVGVIQLKRATYQGFVDTFGKVISNSTFTLMIAAILISVGIIYNSVRVSFSERAWELASLRVLGMDTWQVAQILFIEVGVQVGLSLLPGCLLGWALTHFSLNLIDTETFTFPVVILSSTYAKGILSVIVALIVSLLIVYRMVGRLNPAEALKARE